jgi:hypothetical protein
MRASTFVGLVVAVGCASHRPVLEVHEVAGKEVEISVPGQPVQSAIAIQQVDGLLFRTQGGDVPLESVTRVVEIKQRRGALQGMGIGLGIGVVSGVIIGFAAGDDEPCPDDGQLCLFNFTGADKAALAGILLGLLGAATGGVVGYTLGARDVYDVPASQPRFRPTGPPGSVVGGTVRF